MDDTGWPAVHDLTTFNFGDQDMLLTTCKVHENGTMAYVSRREHRYVVDICRNGGTFRVQTILVPCTHREREDRYKWLYDELLAQTSKAPPWLEVKAAQRGCAHGAEVIACDSFFRL